MSLGQTVPDASASAQAMVRRPRLRRCYRVAVVEPDQVFLLTESRQFVLEGRAFPRLAPLLTGEHSVEDLLERLEAEVPPPEVYYALDVLWKKGHVVEADTEDSPPAAMAFWESLGADGAAAARRLAASRVGVRSIGGDWDAQLRESLAALGIAVGSGADLEVAAVDDYVRPDLAAMNREALASGRPWMLVKPVGYVLWVGPVFVPGETGCWDCLAQRLRGNRQVEEYILARKGSADPLPTSRAALPSTLRAGASLASTEIARWLVLGRDSRREGRVLTFDVLELKARENVLVRRPQCPACGEPGRSSRAGPIVLTSRPKRFRGDGGHRVEPPEETFERLRHHISPVTGIVSSLERLSDEGTPLVSSYSAGHNFAMLTDTLFFLRQNLRGHSGGKGMTDVQARVSGICEAMERYSGVFRGDEPVVRESLRSLGGAAVHPNDCMIFSERQYAGRQAWNAQQGFTKYHIVPEPFDESDVIDWAPAWSLTAKETRYLPAAYCYYGHPDLRKRFFCMSDANGSAAGSTLEEAILQGFLELVERDAVALWWYNRIRRPALDIDSFGEPYLSALRDYYRGIHREFWVLDITSDLGVPTFVGVSRRADRPVEDIVIGFGAHFDPRVALLRAMTEVNQFFPAVSRSNPDGSTFYWFPDRDAVEWWKTATVANQPYVAPDPRLPVRTAADHACERRDDLREDVEACVELASRHGLDLLVLDQSRPDVGVSVAKVVVPGLRHFWRRLGLGRLYEAPARLGWLSAPNREEDVNPVSIFF